MLSRLRALLDFMILLGVIGASLASFSGLLGAFFPLFDLVNHFQLPFLVGAVIALIATFIWPFHYSAFKPLSRIILMLPLVSALTFIMPELVRHLTAEEPQQAELEDGTLTPLRMMSFNIYMGTWDGAALAGNIGRYDPDLVTLQEYAPRRFRNQPDLKERFPYQARCQTWRNCTLAILSKHPMDELERYELGRDERGNPLHGKMLAATVRPHGLTPFRVYSVHLSWPQPIKAKLDQLARAAEIIHEESARYPRQVLAGDFNQTGWSFAMSHFVGDSGLSRHSHLLLTFPSSHARIKGLVLPPFLSLDHILTSPALIAGPAVRGVASFGDHSPILGTLYLGKP